MTNLNLVTGGSVQAVLVQIAKVAKLKADDIDQSFLKHADPRAVQGGAVDEEAQEWRLLERLLHDAARQAGGIEG